MNRNRVFLVWLATLFLLTQQGAVLHVLTHIPEELQQSQQQKNQYPAHSDTCELCIAYAAIGAGLLPSALLIATTDVVIVYMAEAQSSVLTQPLLAYLSRAPPVLA